MCQFLYGKVRIHTRFLMAVYGRLPSKKRLWLMMLKLLKWHVRYTTTLRLGRLWLQIIMVVGICNSTK